MALSSMRSPNPTASQYRQISRGLCGEEGGEAGSGGGEGGEIGETGGGAGFLRRTDFQERGLEEGAK